MNLQNIISEIEKVDPEVYGRLDTRRSAMKKFANVSGKIAIASIPLALGSMFQTAYGQTSTAVTDVLNFALTLEYLEAEFYNNIVGSAGYLTAPAAAQTALAKIKDDENKHVAFLKTALGAAAVAKPTFDFTGGKGFAVFFEGVLIEAFEVGYIGASSFKIKYHFLQQLYIFLLLRPGRE